MDSNFPSREELLIKDKEKNYSRDSLTDMLIYQAKSIDLEKVNFDSSDFKPRNKIIEKQKVYRWTRLFIKDEISDLKINDIIKIKYINTDEVLETNFICFGKKGLEKDSNGNIVAFEGEEDKKVLCLMLDIDKLEDDSISFIRSLFQNTKWYESQLLKRSDLLFINKRTNEIIEYFDVEF